MSTRRIFPLLFLTLALCIVNIVSVYGQADDSAEPTTVSNVANATLPRGAQRVLEAKVPAEFNELFDKIVAEGGGKIAGGAREVLAWQGNYKTKAKSDGIKSELTASFRKDGWQFETLGSQDGVELFSLAKNSRAVIGYFVANEQVFVCALMEAQKADAAPAQKDDSVTAIKPAVSTGGNIVGKWFRTTGGSSIDWTGKTTLKGGDDYSFQFSADGSVEYTHKKEILNIMQCKINSEENARGRYTLNGGSLTIDLGAMRSTGSNSCNSKENYNKTLGNSSMTVKVQIRQMDDITRPDKPYQMCFDGNEVCYEKLP